METRVTSIAVLMALHNRQQMTKLCIESLLMYAPENWRFKFFFVDDGSTDNTFEYLTELRVEKQITCGDGEWYWARSMQAAESSIDQKADYILWLNNDVTFNAEAFGIVEKCRRDRLGAILVGQFANRDTEILSYGGFWRASRNPLKYNRRFVSGEPTEADTFNGNFVLIPWQTARMIGSIDGEFAHAYADCDYGLRAKELGVSVLILPGFLGFCDANIEPVRTSVLKEIRELSNIKNSPLRSQVRFFKRHGGLEWPIYCLTPYLRIFYERVKNG